MSRELAERVQVAFDRCKEFPEVRKDGAYFMVKGDAYMALIELRNLAPQVVLELQEGGRDAV